MLLIALIVFFVLLILFYRWLIPIFIWQIYTYPHRLLLVAASVLLVYSFSFFGPIMSDEGISWWVKFLITWGVFSAYMILFLWTQEENAKIRNRRDKDRDDS